MSDNTTTFTDLGVDAAFGDALAEHGIVHPFPIQEMAIPIALQGTDLIGQARTGTGKTLAFGLPLLQRIDLPTDTDEGHGTSPQALVIAPTRELANQVGKDLVTASAKTTARILTVYGGTPYEPQLEALAAGIDVVVGTPGRLLDLANRRALDLSRVRIAVLDEADEMLDLGFLPDVERLMAKTAKNRQTLMFSATMPAPIVALARAHLHAPVNIRAEHQEDVQTVPATRQFIYQAHPLDKPEVIARILQAKDRDRVMIFCRTKRGAQRLADDLCERGFSAAAIHGDRTQAAREQALRRFREGRIDVLVATDVAARGIDVTGVTHVINYECPEDSSTYVHRIGRTGRAGAEGVAVTLVDWADLTRWKVINKTLGLDLPEPQETYSTSEHLFTELGIDPAATSQVGPPKPTSGAAGHKGGKTTAAPVTGARHAGHRSPTRSAAPRHTRTEGRPESTRATVDTPATPADTATGEAVAPRRRRRRRIRREGGGAESSPAPAE
ncbi:DEAD/DEAH box helicase [Raineyella fluvialis]|uniref:RNA helicase n=1 Tax=Raineyella fluvialis TaxID=2662261 RepID=A0A5Q2FBZ4_9ACTN|nr:DEAD/DEAH box helicase [Raineyella fluvialis]QGF24412.1 DEAD/DEAH box helicase [Raineyella fluvialis]